MKTQIIVNPRAGGWSRVRRLVKRLAREDGARLLRTDSRRPLQETLCDALRNGCQRLVVAGGDGTLSRVVNALGPRIDDLELAVLPIGTGNDFARSIGVPSDALDKAWHLAFTGPVRQLDLVQATNGARSCVLNAATAGFGGKISTDVNADDKYRWGAIAYWMTAFSRLVALSEYKVRLELESETITLPLYGLAIANGRFVGGGFPVAPLAWLDDGLLDVTTIPVLPTLELLGAGIDFAIGRGYGTHGVKTYRSSYLRIHAEPDMPFSLDGEPTRSIDATFEVIPKALRMVTGSDAVAVHAVNTKSQRAVVTT